MIHPPFLKPGDMVGVMAPSSWIAQSDLETARTFLEGQGYRVYLHPQCYAGKGPSQYAGTVSEKIAALHDLAGNKEIKAVFFATGGMRSLTILDGIDYKLIAANPKIYMGFSDHTALLNSITAKTGLITFHGPTFKRLPKNPQADFNLRLLAGAEKEISLSGATILRDGTANGQLIGGNLSVFRSLGDKDIPASDGAILFLEDIKEELSTIDRNLCALRRSGFLGKASALIFGQFTDCGDSGTPFGMTLEEIILEHTAGLNSPILVNAPFGHDVDLPIFPVGQKASLAGTKLTLIS